MKRFERHDIQHYITIALKTSVPKRRILFWAYSGSNLEWPMITSDGSECFELRGARGRTRTGMEFPPRDFKSLASTSFATRAGRFLVICYSVLNSDCGPPDLYWLVATRYRSGNFTWFVQPRALATSTEPKRGY